MPDPQPLPLEAPQACLVLWERHGAAVEMLEASFEAVEEPVDRL